MAVQSRPPPSAFQYGADAAGVGNHQGGGRGEGRAEVEEIKSASDTCGELVERN